MNERRHLLVVGATILGVLLFGLFVLKPRASSAAELRADIAAAEAEQRTLEDHLSTLLEASLHRDEFERDAREIQSLLPSQVGLIRTIRLLNRASIKAGVDLREIAPGTPTDHLTVSNAKTISTTLVVEGSYDRIEAFIGRVEELDRAMQLMAYTFSPSQEGNRTIISAAMNLEMYVFDPDAAAVSAPATGAPAAGAVEPGATPVAEASS
jgi:Tfp pilus assembly protein PilO